MKKHNIKRLTAELAALRFNEARTVKEARRAKSAGGAPAARKAEAAKPAKAADKAPIKIPFEALALSKQDRRKSLDNWHRLPEIFRPAEPPPGVVPKDRAKAALAMAMDESPFNQVAAWAASALPSAVAEGVTFLGYAYLSELAQRPEYRRISETIATQMTRKWIKLQSTGSDAKAKSEKLKKLEDAMTRLAVRDVFREVAEQDGFFGRSHIYIDLGTTDDRDELRTPIGDGANGTSKSKIRKGSLKRLKTVEPIWCYPSNYDTTDPLKPGWYKPEMWFVQAKEVHASRLLTFIGREVPDILKPAYSFGGLSLSQMAKPYVDNWLRTRQSVSDLIEAFSAMVLKTDLSTIMQDGGQQLFTRIDFFNNVRSNRGTMAINKDTEEFDNVSAPLGTLDMLQAQSQEHMAAVSGIPLIFLLGISPAGLNASSEGEIRTFYDWIAAYQEMLFRKNLTKVINFIQLSEFGKVDPEITYVFEPLWSMDEKAKAEVDKMEAETDQIHIDSGVLAPVEVREKLAADPDSPYASLDVDNVPDLAAEEEDGLEPRGERDEGEAESPREAAE